MAANALDSTSFYRLSNDNNGPNSTMSLGFVSDPPSAPNMTVLGSFSSENWEFFFDSGVFFIRNHDYGTGWQLGLTDDNRSEPQMLLSSGALGMQWNITQWPDGTWRLTNMMLGPVPLFGVSVQSTTPVMNTDEQGAHWTFDINVSAGQLPAMLSAFPSIQTPKSTSSTARTSSTTTSSPQSTIFAPSSSAPKSNSGKSNSGNTNAGNISSGNTNQNHSSSFSVGAIAGVAVGAVAIILGVFALFFLFRRRNRQNSRQRKPPSASLEQSSTSETSYGRIGTSQHPLGNQWTPSPSSTPEQFKTVVRSELGDTECTRVAVLPGDVAEMLADSPSQRLSDSRKSR